MPFSKLYPSLPGRSVQAHLALYALVLIVPILLFGGVLLWQYSRLERDRLESEAEGMARQVAQALDRELVGLSATLDVLSLSANLDAGNLEAFYEQAKSLERRQGVIAVLRDPAGQQLVNVRVPWGTALPVSRLAVDPEVLASKELQVSGLFIGAIAKEPLFSIVAPVVRNDQVAYLLSLSLDVGRIRRVITQEQPPENWTVAVVDQNGLILARNRRHEEFVGKRATQDLLDNTAGHAGTWRGTTVEGAHVFGAYYRSALSGWRVAVGVAEADLNAPLRRSLYLFAGLGLALLALSGLLAVIFGRRITRPIHELAVSAAALGRGEPIQELNGPISEVNGVSRELRRAGDRLIERESALRESNEEIQRFAYIVSHDLRAPLVNIMGFTSELESLRDNLLGAAERPPEEREQLGRDFDESLAFIKAAINKMDGLIGAILKISREGRRSFRVEPVSMSSVVQGLADAIRFQAEETGAAIKVGRLPDIETDRLAVEQIFGNLLDNAVKYLDPDRPGRIEVTGREDGGRVIFAVSDNGRGIAKQDHARVFELFRRAGAQNRPGEGIGLAHVKTLLRAIGGRIDLASEPGVGTTFTISLPKALRSTPTQPTE